jgi:hypothetical protein
MNAFFLLYAIINFIGLQESRTDLAAAYVTSNKIAAAETA